MAYSWLFRVDPLKRFTLDIGLVGPLIAVGILGIDAVLSRVLTPELRRSIKLPASLAWLYICLSAARCFIFANTELDSIFRAIAAVSLSIAIMYTGFILVIDYALGRNGKKPVRSIIRYSLLSISFLAAAMIGLRAGGVATVGVLASGAVVVGGLGAAVAEIVRQLGAGVMVQYTKAFEIGDVLHLLSSNRRGTVLQVQWRTTLLRGPDGVDFVVPNHDLVTERLLNYGHNDRKFRREIDFSGPYDVPPHIISEQVLKTIRAMSGIESEPCPQIVILSFSESSIAYQVWYWTKLSEHIHILDANVRMRIWYAFSRACLQFPYPVRRLEWPSAEEQNIVPKSIDKPSFHSDVQSLQQTHLFTSLPNETLTELLQQNHQELYASRETIVTIGEQGHVMYIILDGEVAICSGQNAHEIKEIFRLHKGDCFGEAALLTGGPRTATVVAITSARVLVLNESTFKRLIQKSPQIAEILSELLIKRQRELAAHETLHGQNSVEQSYTQNALLQKIKALFTLSIV